MNNGSIWGHGAYLGIDYMSGSRSHLLGWLHLPGDLVFILLGAVPLVIAAMTGWLGVRRRSALLP